MDFGFTEEQDMLRKEAHDFYQNELPEDFNPDYYPWDCYMGEEGERFWRGFQIKAGEKGWPTAGWPKKYGGLGLGAIEQSVAAEEQAYWGYTGRALTATAWWVR